MRAKLGVIDWIAAGVAAIPALGLLAFPLVAHTFDAMYGDFQTAALPVATRVALWPWFSICVGLAACAGIALAVLAARTALFRRAALACVFVVSATTLAVCVVAMYLPIFSLAGKIS